MIKYLLDSDICVQLSRVRNVEQWKEFLPFSIREVGTSTITLFELSTGVLKSQDSQRAQAALDLMMEDLTIFDFTPESAREAARIRSQLEKRGTPIGPYDLLIAGIALSNGFTLITNNTREFERIDGLKVEMWRVD